jgi:hypothetical protein
MPRRRGRHPLHKTDRHTDTRISHQRDMGMKETKASRDDWSGPMRDSRFCGHLFLLQGHLFLLQGWSVDTSFCCSDDGMWTHLSVARTPLSAASAWVVGCGRTRARLCVATRFRHVCSPLISSVRRPRHTGATLHTPQRALKKTAVLSFQNRLSRLFEQGGGFEAPSVSRVIDRPY